MVYNSNTPSLPLKSKESLHPYPCPSLGGWQGIVYYHLSYCDFECTGGPWVVVKGRLYVGGMARRLVVEGSWVAEFIIGATGKDGVVVPEPFWWTTSFSGTRPDSSMHILYCQMGSNVLRLRLCLITVEVGWPWKPLLVGKHPITTLHDCRYVLWYVWWYWAYSTWTAYTQNGLRSWLNAHIINSKSHRSNSCHIGAAAVHVTQEQFVAIRSSPFCV